MPIFSLKKKKKTYYVLLIDVIGHTDIKIYKTKKKAEEMKKHYSGVGYYSEIFPRSIL